VTAPVFITNTVQAGQLFIPMHYSVANERTFTALDPTHANRRTRRRFGHSRIVTKASRLALEFEHFSVLTRSAVRACPGGTTRK
jgi:hypothetical protein